MTRASLPLCVFALSSLAACMSDSGTLGSITTEGAADEVGESEDGESEGEAGSESGTEDTGESSGPETETETETSEGELPASCGNGEVEGTEECDDGNDVALDGCESDCTVTPVVEILAGGGISCVRLEGGGVKCWGSGLHGAMGYGNSKSIGDNEHIAGQGLAPLGDGVVELALGSSFTCGRYDDGGVKCWGRNIEGQLGYGHEDDLGNDETPESYGPIELGGPAVRIATGNAGACAILEGGAVRCWGVNDYGRLGLGHTEDIGDDEVPTAVPTVDLGGFVAAEITMGSRHVCVLNTEGELMCWGQNLFGQLGYGIEDDIGDDEHPAAVGLVPVGGPVEQVVAGSSHTCAKLVSGDVRCWGHHGLSALGTANDYMGDDEPASAVPFVQFSAPVAELAGAGGNYACARLETGTVECWGDNREGQLGLGHEVEVAVPAGTPGVGLGGATVVDVSSGWNHSCALLEGNQVICWGNGSRGKLGTGLSEANIGDNELPIDWGTIDLF